MNDALKWTGQLSPGKGHVNIDYSKSIVLNESLGPDFALPKEVIPEAVTGPTSSNTLIPPMGGLHAAKGSYGAQSMH